MSSHVLDKLNVRVGRLTMFARAVGPVVVLAVISPTASFAQSAIPVAPPPSSSLDVPTIAGDRHIHSQRIAGPMEAAPPC
jgi:hypothetical protein